MKLLGATGSHVGNVREANQDRVFFRGLVAALADGMGGHQGGERAAELAIGEFQQAGQKLSEGDLVEVVLQANREVHGHAADNGLPGMGTTVVAMTLHEDDTITVANVGDSRAYWLRGDYMGQVTEDHSFVEDLVRQGRLTPSEAANHPQRNILTRAVGIGAEVEVDRFPIPEPEIGDRFLLCSDGLFNELSEDDILDILLENENPAETAVALIEATLRTPCRDNVTVAVVDLVADDDPRLAAQQEAEAREADREADGRGDKVITAPIPVVSKSVLHDPPIGDNGNSGAKVRNAGANPVGSGRVPDTRPDGADGAQRGSSAKAGTLLLAEADADGGRIEVDARPDPNDPERFLDTAELEIVEDVDPAVVEPRSRLLMGFGALLVAAGLVVGGYFLARAYAGSGFFIAEGEAGRLTVFEGRRGGFLGFEPTVVAGTEFTIDALDDTERKMVADDFSTLNEAEAVIDQIEVRHAEAEAQALIDAASDGGSGTSDSSQDEDTAESNTQTGTSRGATGTTGTTQSASSEG